METGYGLRSTLANDNAVFILARTAAGVLPNGTRGHHRASNAMRSGFRLVW